MPWIMCLWVIVSLLQTFSLTDSTSNKRIPYFEASNRSEEAREKWNQSCCQSRETTYAELLSMFSQGFKWLGFIRQIDTMLSQHFLPWVTGRNTRLSHSTSKTTPLCIYDRWNECLWGSRSFRSELLYMEAINQCFISTWIPDGPAYFLFSSLMSILNSVHKNYVEC